MPYKREGAMKVTDHWVRSPLAQHRPRVPDVPPVAEAELQARVDAIQDRTHALLERVGAALIDMLEAIEGGAKAGGATDEQLAPALALQRKAQWRLDFVSAENSMGFHAPQETARVLAEAIDYARQGQIVAAGLQPASAAPSAPRR